MLGNEFVIANGVQTSITETFKRIHCDHLYSAYLLEFFLSSSYCFSYHLNTGILFGHSMQLSLQFLQAICVVL